MNVSKNKIGGNKNGKQLHVNVCFTYDDARRQHGRQRRQFNDDDAAFDDDDGKSKDDV